MDTTQISITYGHHQVGDGIAHPWLRGAVVKGQKKDIASIYSHVSSTVLKGT
jgi:hypothetical protein